MLHEDDKIDESHHLEGRRGSHDEDFRIETRTHVEWQKILPKDLSMLARKLKVSKMRNVQGICALIVSNMKVVKKTFINIR